MADQHRHAGGFRGLDQPHPPATSSATGFSMSIGMPAATR